MRAWLNALERWFLPSRCVLTGQGSDHLDIADTLVAKWSVPEAVCPVCCEPSALAEVCGHCLTQPPAFERTQVGFYFEAELADLIHALKYRNQPAYARLLAELLAERLDVAGVEAMVAVPLYAKRRRERGYNQAELLGQALSKITGIPLLKGVRRIKDTPSQTLLNAEQRRRNLHGAFSVDAKMFKGVEQIALLDDVVTTGATMQALAHSLKTVTQVKSIQAWAVAKTK
ncbi:ComF family protein [Thiomicrorhabdus cannonii]|uniref:ComF family protein n=1 Tax=Thiomicrorhabdus cannonii TaxID=2748011 RepID=UPI0015C06390|nr:ComF family protein [Thiomicrorhabdus cannonii]